MVPRPPCLCFSASIVCRDSIGRPARARNHNLLFVTPAPSERWRRWRRDFPRAQPLDQAGEGEATFRDHPPFLTPPWGEMVRERGDKDDGPDRHAERAEKLEWRKMCAPSFLEIPSWNYFFPGISSFLEKCVWLVDFPVGPRAFLPTMGGLFRNYTLTTR